MNTKQRKTVDKVPCNICTKMFTPKHRQHKNCSPRCSYISNLLYHDNLDGMSRNNAIVYYGKRYDDPIRSVGNSKHKLLMRAIYNYCEEHNTTTFTRQEIATTGVRMCPQSLFMCAAEISAVSKTGRRVRNAAGNPVIEWQLRKELL